MHPVSNLIQNPQAIAVWFDALLKSFVVLGFAGGVCVIWRRAAAATRHLIWFLALATLPLLPLLPRVLPTVHRPLWSVSSEMVSGNQISVSLELTPTLSSGNSVPVQAQSPGGLPTVKSARRLFNAQLKPNRLAMAIATWAAGMVLMLLYCALGRFQLRRISRDARLLDTPEWTRLLVEACNSLRLRRGVVLLQSSENVMPLTWGWLRPRVLMPAEAEHWAADRRRVVLLHELAHIKRQDCLTQTIARTIAALYWFNPLAWVATRQMCIERERACDDLVLNGGCKASDYAGHLVQIAKAFRRAPQAAGIAMARSSNLEQRVTAIVDASRARRLRPLGLVGVLISTLALLFCIGGYKTSFADTGDSSLRQQQIARLEEFSKQKLAQSKILAASSGEVITPEFQRLFDAATSGDAQTVTNMYASFKQRHPQYSHPKGTKPDYRLRTSYWGPVLEIDLAYDHIVNCNPKYTDIAVNDIVNSIPAGAIYFGGTDPGRGLPTAFSKSQVDADPFYTLTQNALADPTYLEYLQQTYGEKRRGLAELAAARSKDAELVTLDAQFQVAQLKLSSLKDKPYTDPEYQTAQNTSQELAEKIDRRINEVLAQMRATNDAGTQSNLAAALPSPIYIPTPEDLQKCFQDYLTNAQARLAHDKNFPNEKKQLKPGEDIHEDKEGHVQVSGQVAVMGVNARTAKVIFDKNPGHEFYIEESWPLDWMYPYVEPHGPIMKINREPLTALPDEVVQKDREYWQNHIGGMIGDWIGDDTSVQTITSFADKVFAKKDLSGFNGDPAFVQNEYASKSFSHWRYSIAGIYAWRAEHAGSAGEKQRMAREADFAFRQAFALCPYNPEGGTRYAEFLKNQGRIADARLIADAGARAAAVWDPKSSKLRDLSQQLKQQAAK